MSGFLQKPGPGGPPAPTFVSNEIPAGAIDGVNDTFTLANAPSPAGSLQLFLNGALQQDGGGDFILTTNSIVFNNPPLVGSILIAYYMY